MNDKADSAMGRRGLSWLAAIVGLGILLLAGRSYGQEKLDLQAIIKETQKMTQAPTEMTMVWWIPEQFWQASFQANPNVTQAQSEQVLKTMRPYTMVAVVDGQIGSFGGVTYRNAQDVRASVALEDAKGQRYAPLDDAAVDPDMKNLVQMLRPIVANVLGPLGQNMNFFLFPAKTKSGQALADPTLAGMFDVVVAEKKFTYRLPLGSVLPPKYDPGTREKFPGNYNFNPFTGGKLVDQAPKGI